MEIATLNMFSVSMLLFLLAFATWIDLRDHRIPNGVVINGLIIAIGIAVLDAGLPGLAGAIAGIALGGALLLPYYMLGGMGAGDVKLMAMTGAFLGPKLVVGAVVLTLLSGVVIGVFFLFGWRLARMSAGYRLIGTVWPGWATRHGHASHDSGDDRAPALPYALAILTGASGALFWFFQLGPALP